MRAAAYEAAHAYKSRPGGCGITPGQRLLGARPRQCGVLLFNGEKAGGHPEVFDAGSDLARTLEIRRVAREAAERKANEDFLARAAVARSRALTETLTGQRVYFYREVTTATRISRPCRVASWDRH